MGHPQFLASMIRSIGRVLTWLSEALQRVLLQALRRRRHHTTDTAPFHRIQDLINHVAQRDEDVRLSLAAELQALNNEEKDRLTEILIMTLRVEAKKNLVRRRAIAVLAYRLNTVGERLNHIGF